MQNPHRINTNVNTEANFGAFGTNASLSILTLISYISEMAGIFGKHCFFRTLGLLCVLLKSNLQLFIILWGIV